jgi:hypothetical protein
MTASLMPPEVMDAINYASKQYVMLEAARSRCERIAKLVRRSGDGDQRCGIG